MHWGEDAGEAERERARGDGQLYTAEYGLVMGSGKKELKPRGKVNFRAYGIE